MRFNSFIAVGSILSLLFACGTVAQTPKSDGGTAPTGADNSGANPASPAEPSASSPEPSAPSPSSPEPSAPAGPTSPLAGDWQEWHLGFLQPVVSYVHIANDGKMAALSGKSDGTPSGPSVSYTLGSNETSLLQRVDGGDTLQSPIYHKGDVILSAARVTSAGGKNYEQKVSRTDASSGKEAFTTGYVLQFGGAAKATITRSFTCNSQTCSTFLPASRVFRCLRVDEAEYDSDLGFNVFDCEQDGGGETARVLFDEEAMVFGQPKIALYRARYDTAPADIEVPNGVYRSLSGTSFNERHHTASDQISGHSFAPGQPLVSKGSALNLRFDLAKREFERKTPEAGGAPAQTSAGVARNLYLEALLFDDASSSESTKVYRGYHMFVFSSVSRTEYTLILTAQQDGALQYTLERRFCSSASCAETSPAVTTGVSIADANGIPGVSTLTIDHFGSEVNLAYVPGNLVGMPLGSVGFIRVSN